jgi:hypothetical protein
MNMGSGGVKKIIILSGSKTSGGFSIMKPESPSSSVIGQRIAGAFRSLDSNPSFATGSSTLSYAGKRLILTTMVDHGKNLCVSADLLHILGLKTGDKLLVGRGSGLGPAFIARGQIYAEALKHGHISTF